MVVQENEIFVSDPFRRVDWRWGLANRLAESRRRLTANSGDEVTLRAARYVRAKRNGSRSKSDAAVEAAIETRDKRKLVSLEIKARLLAGQSIEEVSGHVDREIDDVTVFASLFFDVTERLHARDWIRLAVLGWRDDKSASALARRFVLHLSYSGGPLVAEAALQHRDVILAAIAGELDYRTLTPRSARQLAALAILHSVDLPATDVTKMTKNTSERELHHTDDCDDFFAPEVQQRLDEVLVEALKNPVPVGPFSPSRVVAEKTA